MLIVWISLSDWRWHFIRLCSCGCFRRRILCDRLRRGGISKSAMITAGIDGGSAKFDNLWKWCKSSDTLAKETFRRKCRFLGIEVGMNEHIVYQKKDKQDLLMIAYLTPSTAYRPRGCTEFEFSNFRNRNWDFVHACYQPDPFFSSPRSIIPMCEILFSFCKRWPLQSRCLNNKKSWFHSSESIPKW